MRQATDLYLDSRRARNCRPATIDSYGSALREFARLIGSDTPLRRVTPQDVEHYVSRRLATTSPATAKLQSGIVTTFLQWASARGLASAHPWADVGHVHVDSPSPRWLCGEECERLIEAAETARTKSIIAALREPAIVRLMIDTGMRAGEVLRLRLSELDLESRTAHISAESKGRRARLVFFTQRTSAALRAYLRVRNSRKRTTDRVFISERSSALSRTRLHGLVADAAQRAGLSDVSPHTLRHSCATMLLDRGLGLHEVQRLLGHASIATTSMYLHADAARLKMAYDKATAA